MSEKRSNFAAYLPGRGRPVAAGINVRLMNILEAMADYEAKLSIVAIQKGKYNTIGKIRFSYEVPSDERARELLAEIAISRNRIDVCEAKKDA